MHWRRLRDQAGPAVTAPLCRQCGKRPARFVDRRGHVKSDEEHDLCLQCYRALREATQAGIERSYNCRKSARHRNRSPR